MAAEEYMEYAEDPTGFIMRKILPRHYAALKGLEMVDFSNSIWQGGLYSMIPCGLPPVKAAFAALSEAGEKMLHTAQAGGKVMETLAGMGWPSLCDQATVAPFDLFNDTLRGFLNTTMDMIECPDELLCALDTSTKMQVRTIKNTFATQPFCKNMVFFLHNGFDMFMSREQFETFYWPGLKACVEAVIECGGVPHLYVEDKYDSKMDIIVRDLPAGKCILTLINCNVEKWKEACQGKICLTGGVDGTLLQFGTPEQVVKNVKDTIDLWAPGGGYILNCDTSLDVAKPENLHALFDTANSYMKY
ncbi:MAG: uroporphyrinogen decarboxylase family protein [Agathobacter sp.]